METVAPASSLASAADSARGDTRLRGRRLLLARAVVFAAIGLTLALYLVALPGLIPQLATPCANIVSQCAVTPQQVAPLAQLGLTPHDLAVITAIISVGCVALVVVVAAVLIWRRSDDWMALFLALTLILMPANFTALLVGLPPSLDGLRALASNASLFSWFLLYGLFPSGRFEPRWLWLVIVAMSLALLPSPAPDDGTAPAVLVALPEVVGVLGLAFLLGSQIYRYRRISNPEQRQQSKWGFYGLVLTIIAHQVLWQPAIWIPALQRPDSLYSLLALPDSALMIVIMAVSFSVAILRYRLYDIDLLVNRTLVYGSLRVILALVYLVGVVGSQSVVARLTHANGAEQSPVSVVLTTLVIAALFQPLRRRLQTFIDLRFYRRKYNAARTLASFADALRDDVNLRDLSDHLVSAVDETMRPAHVSLWLRERAERPAHQDQSTLSSSALR